MSNTNENALRMSRLQAVKLAELKATDAEDMELCVRDLMASANLDEAQARVVAASFRGKTLPQIARQYGLNETVIAQMIGGSEMPLETSDFAKRKKKTDDLGGNIGGLHEGHEMGGAGEQPSPEMSPEDHLGDSGDEMNGNDGLDMGHDPAHESINDEISEHGHMPSPDEEMAEGEQVSDHPADVADAIQNSGGMASPMKAKHPNDLGEANDDGAMATIQIEVPANKLDAVQKALESAFGGSDSGSDMGGGDDMSHLPPVTDDGGDMAPDNTDGADMPGNKVPPHTASRKANTMDKYELAKRAAAREAILAKVNGTRTASEEEKPKDIGLGTDTSNNGKSFQYSEEAQYHDNRTEYPKMTLENSGGNSLRDQNPSYAKQVIPTNNPELIQDDYEVGKKEGSPDGSLEYKVDFGKLDGSTGVPSGGEDRGDKWAIPTEMPELLKRTTNTPNRVSSVHECDGCNNVRKASVDQYDCDDCSVRIAICNECVDLGYCPSCAATARRASAKKEKNADIEVNVSSEDEAKEKTASKMVDEKYEEKGDGPRLNIQPNGDGFTREPKDGPKEEGDWLGDQGRGEGEPSGRKEAEVYKSRVKTAYRVSARLAIAGLMSLEEMDKNVDMWLEDGLSAKAMINQGNLMIRSASASATERVAQTVSENSSRKVNAGYSTSPAMTITASHSGQTDMAQALRELNWSNSTRPE